MRYKLKYSVMIRLPIFSSVSVRGRNLFNVKATRDVSGLVSKRSHKEYRFI